jgi:flagellar motor switch protein FliN/FliY
VKKSTAIDPCDAATEALVRLLPTTAILEAIVIEGARVGPFDSAVVASFVGVTSADLAIIFLDPIDTADAIAADSQLVSIVDMLRPALEAAAGVLGSGVLGESRVENAAALFSDPATEVFALSADGSAAGWFAIRVRESLAGAAPIPQESLVNKLSRISNVEMALTVEIGRTRMSVRDVLGLEPGAVIELDRSAGAAADILLNGRLIAHGEIVVVDQDYAVRITQILDVADGLN